MNVNINVVVPFQPKNFRETNKNQSKEAQFLKARRDPKLSCRGFVYLTLRWASNFLFFSNLTELIILKKRQNPKPQHAPEGPINSLVQGQLGRLNAPNGTLHKFIAKEIAMNTADDDPSLIRQKILRHAHAVSHWKIDL